MTIKNRITVKMLTNIGFISSRTLADLNPYVDNFPPLKKYIRTSEKINNVICVTSPPEIDVFFIIVDINPIFGIRYNAANNTAAPPIMPVINRAGLLICSSQIILSNDLSK